MLCQPWIDQPLGCSIQWNIERYNRCKNTLPSHVQHRKKGPTKKSHENMVIISTVIYNSRITVL